jgi:hypothetical protein
MSGSIPLPLICLHGVHRDNFTRYPFYPHKTEKMLQVVVSINTNSMKKKPANGYLSFSLSSAS